MKLQLPKLVRKRKRLARGIAGKGGKTAGRGTKGQLSRTGAKTMLPKGLLKTPKLRGFNPRAEKPVTLRYDRVSSQFKSQDKVTTKALVTLKLLSPGQTAKIVGPKTDDKQLRFFVKVSKSISA